MKINLIILVGVLIFVELVANGKLVKRIDINKNDKVEFTKNAIVINDKIYEGEIEYVRL